MTPYVLDASAGVEILLGSRTGHLVRAKVPLLGRCSVPDHFFAEVAAALRRSALRGVASSARVEDAVTALQRSPIQTAAIRPLLPRAWTLRGHLTIADALYVALAEELDAPLVTTDGRLASAPGLAIEVIRP